MRKYEGRLIGILGAVIIHLIAGIIFMSFQIKAVQRDLTNDFEIEFAPAEETQDKENLIELPETSIEKVLEGDEEMLNIARNLSNKPDIEIDPDEYIDMVKEELIRSGKLSPDNYIDENKNNAEDPKNESMSFRNDTATNDKNDMAEKLQEMASNYKGPTRIYYDLSGRTHRHLPIPIYKCQGAGIVVLSIDVNQKGAVEKALIIASESSTSDPCLIETAVNTALISRFNPDISSPKIQKGTLTYHFVAQ